MAYRQIPIPAGSSNVQEVAYDDKAGTLKILFVRNNIPYTYYGVPGTVADGFTTSGVSAGQFFRSNILNQYQFDKS